MNIGSWVDRAVRVRQEHALTLTKAKDLLAKESPAFKGDVYVPRPTGRAYAGQDLAFLPTWVETKKGLNGDPINLVVKGSEQDIRQAMERAGWLSATPLSFGSSVRMVLKTALHKPYPDAPVSSLFLAGPDHMQDLAFERPSATTKERDHVRFWDTGRTDAQGKPVWAGAATKDVGVGRNRRGLGPTHRIDPHADEERNLVARDLLAHGGTAEGQLQRGPFAAVNGGGDFYVTDGAAHVVSFGPTLA